MAQQINPPPLASYMGTSVSYSTPQPAPSLWLGKAEEDGSSPLGLCICVGILKEVPGRWLWVGSAPATVAI